MSTAKKMPPVPAKVPWVVVRRLALARAMAIRDAAGRGQQWEQLSQSVRNEMIRKAEKDIVDWSRSGLVIQFLGEYREAESGGVPLVEWSKPR